jgi:hypothetical protein
MAYAIVETSASVAPDSGAPASFMAALNTA